MKWNKITELYPEDGQLIIGARWAYNRGYQAEMGYVEDGKVYYMADDNKSVQMRLEALLAEIAGIKVPDFLEQMKEKGFDNPGCTMPDYWMPMPSCDGLEIYDGCPTDIQMRAEMEKLKAKGK